MGARYVWDKFSVVEQTGYRTRYREVSSSNTNLTIQKSNGATVSIGSSYSFSSTSGTFSTSGNSSYTINGNDGRYLDSGYIKVSSGLLYYGGWVESYNFSIRNQSTGGKEIRSESYQEPYTYYVKGSRIGYVAHASSGQYPSDGQSGNNWFVYVGSDNVDPKTVTLPASIHDGNTISVTVTPSDQKTYESTISYSYQYRLNATGNWLALGSTTENTTVSLEIPVGTTKVEVRARAQDNLGFVSGTWVSSGVINVITNQPPTAPEPIVVENVFADQHLTVTITESVDSDGEVASYTFERRVDGGAWEPVLSKTQELVFSEVTNKDWATVAYRAYATDDKGLNSAYATSQTFEVNPGWVTISGPSSVLGDKPGPFDLDFMVDVSGEPDQEGIKVKAEFDGILVVDITANTGEIIRVHFDTKYLQTGEHTLTVAASKEDYMPANADYVFNVPAISVDLMANAKAEVPQSPDGRPIAWVGLARCILSDDGKDVNTLLHETTELNGVKFAQGTYTGTGTMGADNPCRVETGFKPDVFIACIGAGNKMCILPAPESGDSGEIGTISYTIDDTGVSWYASTAANQLNVSGTKYGYFAIRKGGL